LAGKADPPAFAERSRFRRLPQSITTSAWRFLPAVSLTGSANSPAPIRRPASSTGSSFSRAPPSAIRRLASLPLAASPDVMEKVTVEK
jgi:hypothetical protein